MRSRISSRSDFIHICGFLSPPADLIEKSTHCTIRQMRAFFLAGVAGFGPTNEGVKVPCLTAWLYPYIKFWNPAT